MNFISALAKETNNKEADKLLDDLIKLLEDIEISFGTSDNLY